MAWHNINMVTEGGSSRGISNWRGILDVDRNDPSPRNSPYAKKHSYKFNVGYQREIGRGIQARANLSPSRNPPSRSTPIRTIPCLAALVLERARKTTIPCTFRKVTTTRV